MMDTLAAGMILHKQNKYEKALIVWNFCHFQTSHLKYSMNPYNLCRFRAKSLACALLGLALAGSLAHAATIWSGTNFTFTSTSSVMADVLVPGKVSLARNNGGPLYNPAAGETFAGMGSPKDTLWAIGNLANFSSLTYTDFYHFQALFTGQHLSTFLPGKSLVVHLLNEDTYLALTFSTWTMQPLLHPGAPLFSYVRSTPVATVPMVSITNPAPAAVFEAPATVSIGASASVGSGTVTNVQFFAGPNSLGNATVSPYNILASFPNTGNYPLTAVATAGGVATTSSVVNITVASRPSVTLTNPVDGAVFAAPAHIKLSASATVSFGSVTNVTFLLNNSPFGTVTSPPFTFTTGGAPAGSYAIRAVAKSFGLSATSAVVNVTVVNAVSNVLSSPVVSNGQFAFSYTANPGLTYVVQSTPDFLSWSLGITNVAASNPVTYSESVGANSFRFYRVLRLPNP